MSAPESQLPRRINVGCGFDRRDGYLNVDLQAFHEPDLIADVRDLSSLPDGHFDEMLAIDVLEHLPRSDTERALAEWHRVLATGGTLHVQVPDVVAVGQLLAERDRRADHELFLHHLYGTQAYDGDFHLAGFTDRSLIWAMHRAGFGDVTTHSEHGWLLVASGVKTARGSVSPSMLVGIGYSPGCYLPELDAAGRGFRWCSTHAAILLDNLSSAELAVDVELSLAGHFDGTPVQVTLTGFGEPRTVVLGAEPTAIRTRLRLPADGTRLRLETASPAVVAPGDMRDLRFRITGFAASAA